MAVVKNLMVRIGADYSGAKKGMEGASRQLSQFKNTSRNTMTGVNYNFSSMGRMATESFARIRGAKGIGGVASEVKNLLPVLGRSTTAMNGFGAAALTTGTRLGIAGVAVTALVAVLAVATVGLYKMSQPAVKFEADLGRLNISLGAGARAYTDWAAAQGLAKSTAVELGATYGNLLGSFIPDTKELQNSTQELVQATRVISSFTGRGLDDVFNRIRSGMLGSTEAIEDLGVYVNVSMMESTNAFRKFAGDKSWSQLDFKTQQQIRLAAILEQTYSRYGDKLQNNVMTKQEMLMEQLKDIKLHWSQSFQPIWDAVIPALTRLASGVSWVVEQFSRLSYWLRGWDYDEMTKGTEEQTGAVDNQGDAYGDLADKAKAARKELASFDKLNLLGSPKESGGGSGGGGSGGSGSKPKPLDPIPGGLQIPELPKVGLVFEPPTPPDAGMGAVATAVVSTVNSMNADVKVRMGQLWGTMETQSQMGLAAQKGINLGLSQDWKKTVDAMQKDLKVATPVITPEWAKIGQSIADLQNPLVKAQTEWNRTLDYQQKQINAYRPYLTYGWQLIGQSVNATNPILQATQKNWSTALSGMQTDTANQLSKINVDIKTTTAAWEQMQKSLNTKPVAIPAPTPSPSPSPVRNPSPSPVVPKLSAVEASRNLPVIGPVLQGLDWIKENTKSFSDALQPFMVPGAAVGNLGGAGIVTAGKIDAIIKSISGLLKGSGVAVPAFASGAVVYGPTLAMVGDNKGASTNPEVIAPLSDLENIMGNNGNPEELAVLRAILQAVKESRTVQAVIDRRAITDAAIHGINDRTRQTGHNPLTI